MPLSITPLTPAQSISGSPHLGAATTQDFVMYTCPANIKAKVIGGSVYIDSYGSDTLSRLRYNGNTVLGMISSTDPVGTTKAVPEGVLLAGQTITKNGNGSGNSNMRFNLIIQEVAV